MALLELALAGGSNPTCILQRSVGKFGTKHLFSKMNSGEAEFCRILFQKLHSASQSSRCGINSQDSAEFCFDFYAPAKMGKR